MSFAAKYHGPCAGCPHGIEPGDDVEFVDAPSNFDQLRVLVHVGCTPDESSRRDSGPMCGSCFTYHRGGCA